MAKEVKKIIEKRVNDILGHLDISPDLTIEKTDNNFKIIIDGDDLSFLIGRRGSSLDALRILLAHMVYEETGNWEYIDVDINGYKQTRSEKVKDMVRNFIDRVRFHREDVSMPSMSAYERRQVHMFVSDYPDIDSESVGEGRDRHVVLKLKE